MNSFNVSSWARYGSTTAFDLNSFLSLCIPALVVGTLLDTLITRTIGSQHCYAKENGTSECKFGNAVLYGWEREGGRTALQMTLIATLVFVLLRYAPIYYQRFSSGSVYGTLAIAMFVVSQTGLFEDFRRFISGIVFRIFN